MMPRGVPANRETEFRMAYQNLANTVERLARMFGVSERAVYATARRLNLPHRLGMLRELQRPPFGTRRSA